MTSKPRITGMTASQIEASFGPYSSSESRSLENPNVPLTADGDWGGAPLSAAGVRVGYRDALMHPGVFSAVSLIAKDVGRIPLCVYRNLERGREIDRSHAAFKLSRRRPFRYMSAFQFRMSLTAQALLRGNGYAFIVRNKDGIPRELIPLDPQMTKPELEGRRLFYRVRLQLDESGEQIILQPEDVFHIRGLGDGIEGVSVIHQARNTLGVGLVAERYAGRFFGNNARPGVLLTHPGRLKPETKTELKRQWNALHQGDENAFKTAILDAGIKVEPFSMSNEDAQFVELQGVNIRHIAAWFRVPPHKIGADVKTASHSSLEQENQRYLDETLDPWLTEWESESHLKLLTRPQQDRDTHAIEFVREHLVRANLKDRAAYLKTMIEIGVLSRNEAREELNRNAVDGLDEYLVPLNMGSASDLPADSEESDLEDQSDSTEGDASDVEDQEDVARNREAERELLRDSLSRLGGRFRNKAIRMSGTPQKLFGWLDRGFDSSDVAHVSGVLTKLAPVLRFEREQVEDRFLSRVKESLLQSMECKEDELRASLGAVSSELEESIPTEISQEVST